MKDRIATIEARLAKATPGQWNYFYKLKYDEHHVSVPAYTDSNMTMALFPDGCPSGQADAEFIANAPDDMRFLLEALKEAESENKALFDTNIEHEAAIEENLTAECDRWKARAEVLERLFKTHSGYICQCCIHEESCAENGDICKPGADCIGFTANHYEFDTVRFSSIKQQS